MNLLRQLFLNNLGLKAISLILALLTWLAVPRRQTVQTTFPIPVELANLPEELEISNNYEKQVDVDIRSELGSAIEGGRLAAVIDLRQAAPGTTVIHLSEESIRNKPHQVEILSIRPSTIKLELERIEVKIAKIEAEIIGQVAEGYEITSTTAIPPGVTVTGPGSRLRNVAKALTEPVDVESRSTSLSQTVSVYVEDPRLRIQNPKSVTVHVTIEEKRQEVKLRKVRVQVVPKGARARLVTRRVDVLGTVPISFTGDLKSSDFLAVADVKELSGNPQIHEVTPQIVVPPEYVELFRTESVTPPQVRIRVN